MGDRMGGEASEFEKIASEVGALVTEKDKAYGNSFSKCGEILKILFPHGVMEHTFDRMLFTTRVLDKLFRIATQPDAYGESPYLDIAGYAILAEKNRRGRGNPREVWVEPNPTPPLDEVLREWTRGAK